MAVKASAHITLHSVVDVQATYRYYLLQSSTLSKPSKPTTNPPDSSWDDSEPTYTSGSTNSLYYVDLTVFSNGTFSYSEVSLSTAYEAAKEAYNKAVSAQGSIDGLQIGGRNLIANSDILYERTNATTGSVNIGMPLVSSYELSDLIGSTVTLSYYVHSPGSRYSGETTSQDISNRFGFVGKAVWSDSTGTNADVNKYFFNSDLSHYNVESQRVYETATINPPTGYDTLSDFQVFIQIYTKPAEDNSETWQIGYPKLENGNKPTDWTQAPEDVSEIISDVESTAKTNTTLINDAQLIIDSIQATISTLVTGENGESLMTQTDTGWTFSIASVQQTLADAVTHIDELNSDVLDTNALVDALQNHVNDLGEYTEYIKFGTDNGKPCIILGETDSVFKVLITNTDIRFMEGSTIPASINNQSLNISKAVISEELTQGGFVWTARSNGNYGLIWRGE